MSTPHSKDGATKIWTGVPETLEGPKAADCGHAPAKVWCPALKKWLCAGCFGKVDQRLWVSR